MSEEKSDEIEIKAMTNLDVLTETSDNSGAFGYRDDIMTYINLLRRELAELKAQREVLAERWVIIRQKGDSWHGDFLLKDRLCETQSEAWRILGPHNVKDRKGILENDWRAIRVALIKREEV